jgi:hypothetical protein
MCLRWQMGWLADVMIGRRDGWQTGWLADGMVGWQTGWLADGMVGSLVGSQFRHVICTSIYCGACVQ